jgi:hypothetical protein
LIGVPSVNFQQRADDPGLAVNIRGLQDFGRVAVVVDGARQNFQRTGHQADGLVYMEPELLAGIDVVRGPVANIYGSGAIGGVVSMRTLDSNDILRPGEKFATQLHGLVASNQVQGLGSAFFAARPVDNFDFMIGTTARQRNDYKDGNGNLVLNSHFRVITEIGKVNIRPADGHELKFGFINYESAFDNGLPNATKTATVFATDVTNQIATGRWRYNKPDDKLFDFDINTYWTKNKTEQTKTEGVSNAATGVLGAKRSFQVETVGFDVNNTSRWESGPWRAALTVGGDAFRDQVTVVDPTGTGDFFTPNGQRTVRGALRQLPARRRERRRFEWRPRLAQGDARHHADPVVHGLRNLRGRLPGAGGHRSLRQWRAPAAGAVLAAEQSRPQAGNRQDQGNRHQHQVRRSDRRQRCAAHQGQYLSERHHRFRPAGRAGERSAGAGWRHLHDADFRLHPVSERSVGAHPRCGVRRQLRRRRLVPWRRSEHAERREPHQEPAAGEDLSGAGHDNRWRARLGAQSDGGGALARGRRQGCERYSAVDRPRSAAFGDPHGLLQRRQPLSRLPAERGHNSGLRHR